MAPRLRTDLVEVYVFERTERGPSFLQLRRAHEPMAGSWQPIIGHARPAEHAAAAARRELAEEVGLAAGDGRWLGFWQLEEVHPYYMASGDAVVLSPRFAAEVAAGFVPALEADPDAEHDSWRWSPLADAGERFMWPGQVRACEEVARWLLRPQSACEPALRLPTS